MRFRRGLVSEGEGEGPSVKVGQMPVVSQPWGSGDDTVVFYMSTVVTQHIYKHCLYLFYNKYIKTVCICYTTDFYKLFISATRQIYKKNVYI